MSDNLNSTTSLTSNNSGLEFQNTEGKSGPSIQFRLRRFMFGFLLASVTGFGMTPLLPKYYESLATLVFNVPDPSGKLTILKQDLDEKAIQSEIDVLTSLPLTAEVLRRLDLADDPEFNASPNPDSIEWISKWIPTTRDYDPAHRALALLTVQHDRRSYTIRLGYQSKNPEKSAKMTEMLSKIYLENLTERKQKIYARDIDIARSKLLSISFRDSQLSASISEMNNLATSVDMKDALVNLISEKARIAEEIDLARAQIDEAVARQKNAEPDAEMIAPPRRQSVSVYPNPLLLGLSILLSAGLLGTLVAMSNIKNVMKAYLK